MLFGRLKRPLPPTGMGAEGLGAAGAQAWQSRIPALELFAQRLKAYRHGIVARCPAAVEHERGRGHQQHH
ncbi:protein of unknown function (plasmid) [Cupriavidus taiwanensis]|uniref:Uncharacterized protein n=1 Tax=Cupriavidus taiwanensis TaxID=164546 RepID=A0A375HEC3_9BURK|nr:protein of unknown function [Cupriavidus taiwanensis]SOZ72165.1 protein of unknown function [Cupriavidus taiwanensis]SOZ74463.1 protein of unknown function [Cupriavidus taiwanensis]SPA11384.1 protein of unknown function [Cupriavidus taiwanensis]SPD48739.1 protein of unknown function [Cupriavidus taiwanensis]